MNIFSTIYSFLFSSDNNILKKRQLYAGLLGFVIMFIHGIYFFEHMDISPRLTLSSLLGMASFIIFQIFAYDVMFSLCLLLFFKIFIIL